MSMTNLDKPRIGFYGEIGKMQQQHAIWRTYLIMYCELMACFWPHLLHFHNFG